MSSEKEALLSNSHDESRNNSVSYGIHGNSTTLNNEDVEYYGNQGVEPSVGGINQINLSWENINVSVEMKSENKKCCRGSGSVGTKHILKNISGMVQPGRLLAIMGASGAGKSTLMNVLTGRNINQYQLEGQIKVNGIEVGRGIKNISAYCQQDELFISTLTVREHLQFRALLRMERSISKAGRLQRVEEVIRELGLLSCANTQIGGERIKGISGGERKRLSFASEVLTNPPLMFCDEPTSGIDTFMAMNVIQTLKTMANKGRTILCTIHQPSSEVYAMFDQVLLLAEGRTAFLGSAKDAFLFFKQLNYPCPNNYNPADFYILTLAIVPGEEKECKQKVAAISDAFDSSTKFDEIRKDMEKVNSRNLHEENMLIMQDAFASDSQYSASWLQQFRAVFWRSWISILRDVFLFRVRVAQTMIVGVILGLIYLQQDYDQTGVMNINGAMFLFITNMSFTSMFSVVNTFPIEVGIFLREYGSGLYRVDIYYLCKSLAELPSFVLLPIIFSAVVYWMVGLYNSVDAFLICTGYLILVALTAMSFGYLISTLTKSVNIALAIAPPILIPFMLFGGFFLNNLSVPDYFIWLEYISWFKYANEMISVNQWKRVGKIDCPTPPNSSLPYNGTVPNPGCLFPDGQSVLNYLNFSDDNFVQDISWLVGLLVAFRLLSFILLLIRARRSSA